MTHLKCDLFQLIRIPTDAGFTQITIKIRTNVLSTKNIVKPHNLADFPAVFHDTILQYHLETINKYIH